MVDKFNPNLPVYIGTLGLLLGLIFLLTFLFRRIRWVAAKATKKQVKEVPRLMASLRNMLLIFLWFAISGMVLFVGFFFRAYHVFTLEEPVAEVITQPGEVPGTSQVTLIQILPDGKTTTREFTISGDQWMLEGDILKWHNWMNFLGWHTRYRLTRLRGRYLQVEDELAKERTIYPLVENENHPIWRYLYEFGYKMPFVSTAYGNAVFQTSGRANHFLVFVGTSGFIVRKKEPQQGDL